MSSRASLILKKKNTVIEIKKHSSLIQIDNRNISYYWKKIFNWIIYLVKKQLEYDPERQEFNITLAELKYITWIEQTNHQLLKDCLISIQDTKIEYNLLGKDKEEIWKRMNLISELSYIVNGRSSKDIKGERWKVWYFTISLPPTIRDSILYPSIFSKLNLFLLKNLTTKYSINLYEFLKDYERKPWWHWRISVELDILKQVVGVEENNYSAFAMFRKRVINPSLKQINKSMDIKVSYDSIKTWRKYTHIQFSISPKKKDLIEKEKTSENAYIEMRLQTHFKLGIQQVKDVLLKHKEISSLMTILLKIEQDYKNGKIENIWPYTYKVLMVGSVVEKSLFDKEIEQDNIEKRKREEKKKEEEKIKKQEELEKERNERNVAEEYYISLSKEEKQFLLSEYEEWLNGFSKEQYQKFWVENPLWKWQFLVFVYKKISK